MNLVTLRRIAIISAVLTVLLAIDGIYMLMSHYNNGETQNYHLPDGTTVLIAAALLLVLTITAFVLSNRSQTTYDLVSIVTDSDTVSSETPTSDSVASQNLPIASIEPEVQR